MNREVNQRAVYSYYAKLDFRVLRAGDKRNCSAIAFTKYVELTHLGILAEVVGCVLPDGTGHAYTKAGDWALGNRYEWPVPVAEACR